MLAERLRDGLRTAIKARDRVAMSALRSALAAIADREEAAHIYAAAGQAERADLLLAEVGVLRGYVTG
jgi:uncharacterized protein YqeY